MKFTIKELITTILVLLVFTVMPLFFINDENGLLGLAFIFFPLLCIILFLVYGLIGGQFFILPLLPGIGVVLACFIYYDGNTSFLVYAFIYIGFALASMSIGLGIHYLAKRIIAVVHSK